MARHAASKYAYLPDARLEEIRAAAANRSKRFIENYFQVPEDRSGDLLPFKFNWTQDRAYQIYKEEKLSGKPVRLWFLKARRVGLTSLFAADDIVDAWSKDNRRVGIIAHNDDRARRILAMCKSFYKRVPLHLQLPLSKDATGGLKFLNHDSELIIGTCKFPEKVRGDGLHRAHLSEAAWYGNTFSLVMNEISTTIAPESSTAMIIETTGRNRGSSAHKHWDASKEGATPFRAVFLPWIEDPTAIRGFSSDLHKKVIMDEIQSIEPRLAEKNRYFKLSAEQCHWAYWQYVYRCSAEFDYFSREFPYDEEEAWASEGSSFFGDNEITKMQPDRNYKIYSFKDRFLNSVFTKFEELSMPKKIEDDGGALHLKVWAVPVPNRPYVIGADVSLGEEGGTFSAGYVIDMETREMMLAYHGRIRPDEHACLLVSLGTIYNNAILGPEVNPGGGGMAVLTDIYRLSYFNVYTWRHRDSIEGPYLTKKAGWWTTPTTRPLALGELRKMFREIAHLNFADPGMFRDKMLLEEMRSFHCDPESNRPQAAEGAYDDRIMALAIAHRVAADEVLGGALDIYAQHDQKQAPHQKMLDQIASMEQKYDRPDPTDIIDQFMTGDFTLQEGAVQWS
jgi:hypothetical protein